MDHSKHVMNGDITTTYGMLKSSTEDLLDKKLAPVQKYGSDVEI
jgi:hypothetical protein